MPKINTVKPEIKCRACGLSIYIALNYEKYTPWDWERGICGICSTIIPEHIPEKQFNWYTLMHTKLKGEENDSDSNM